MFIEFGLASTEAMLLPGSDFDGNGELLLVGYGAVNCGSITASMVRCTKDSLRGLRLIRGDYTEPTTTFYPICIEVSLIHCEDGR